MRALRWLALEGSGGAWYGYSHQIARQRAALRSLGWTEADAAPIALHVGAPVLFPFRQDGVLNVLSTHVEAESLSPEFVSALQSWDLILMGSTWAAGVVRRHVPGARVEVVPLGVEGIAPRRRRRSDDRPFRFLWVGSPAPRKGHELLFRPTPPLGLWWDHGWVQRPAEVVELYAKTSRHDEVGGDVKRWAPNLIVDSRRLDRAALVDLYHSADCFLFPSYGEGFGLPLLEAMASGCPAIWTHATGVIDFAEIAKREGAGFAAPHQAVKVGLAGGPGFADGCMAPQARREGLSLLMARTIKDHRKLSIHAKRAGEILARRFTWEASGRSLDGALRRLLADRQQACTESERRAA